MLARRRRFRGKLLNRTRKTRKLPEFTVLRCPMVGHQASWCRFLCEPIDGIGCCGRDAPHGLVGKTQKAILERKLRLEALAARRAGQAA